jgi:Holliday junction DNA helicase RuvA
MIAQLRGTIISKTPLEIVIDCGGVGYVLTVSTTTAERLPNAGETATVLTMMIVREDAIQLFGFLNAAERAAFKLLTSISGIGPKIAIGVLSATSISDLRELIARNDLLSLQKLPGIGKKTAERILVELRDKLRALEDAETQQYDTDGLSATASSATQRDVREETLAAMVTLGYPRAVADKAVRAALAAEPEVLFTVEKLLRKALKNVAR